MAVYLPALACTLQSAVPPGKPARVMLHRIRNAPAYPERLLPHVQAQGAEHYAAIRARFLPIGRRRIRLWVALLKRRPLI